MWEISRILTEHIYTICSLESQLNFVCICSIRILCVLKVIHQNRYPCRKLLASDDDDYQVDDDSNHNYERKREKSSKDSHRKKSKKERRREEEIERMRNRSTKGLNAYGSGSSAYVSLYFYFS